MKKKWLLSLFGLLIIPCMLFATGCSLFKSGEQTQDPPGEEQPVDPVDPVDPLKELAAGLYQDGTLVKSWEEIKTEYPNAFSGTSIKANGYSSYFESLAGDLIIGDDITSIGDHAFDWCRGLTSITIPDSVTSIGDCAFIYCSSLTSVTIPNSVTSIGEGAFSECFALAEIYDLSSLGITTRSTNNGDVGYYAKVVHKSISEPTRIVENNSVKYYVYGEDYIALCPINRNLTSITISDSCTKINENAFDGYSSLTSITIPSSVTSIGERVFRGCSSLTSIKIPDSVTSIGRYTFSGCSGLTSITIPSSVTSIERNVFESCTNLTSITFEDATTWYYGTQTQMYEKSGGTQIDVTNPTTNATYLKSTYSDYYWYKV